MIRFLQINLGGGRSAQDLAVQTAVENNVNIIIASEFYKYRGIPDGWYSDVTSRSAVVTSTPLPVDDFGAGNGFSWLKTGDLQVYSCYWSPNTSLAEFENFLRQLEANIRSSRCNVIVAGDFNAKNQAWSSTINDAKGDLLLDMIQSLGLTVCNQGNAPTRVKNGYSSHIDITLISDKIARKIKKWRILDEETLSDHKYITFEVTTNEAKALPVTGWSTRRMNGMKFINSINSNHIFEGDADACAKDLTTILTQAMDEAAPRKSQTFSRRKSVYWWSPKLKQLRTDNNHLRRVYQRKRKKQGDLNCET